MIDWTVEARLQQLVVRVNRADGHVRLHLLVDISGSMTAGLPRQLAAARKLAAALCYVAVERRDEVGVATFDETIRTHVAPASGPTAVVPDFRDARRRNRAAARRASIGRSPTTARPRAAAASSSYCQISSRHPSALEGLRFLLYRGFVPAVVQILAPEELRPDIDDEMELADIENHLASAAGRGRHRAAGVHGRTSAANAPRSGISVRGTRCRVCRWSPPAVSTRWLHACRLAGLLARYGYADDAAEPGSPVAAAARRPRPAAPAAASARVRRLVGNLYLVDAPGRRTIRSRSPSGGFGGTGWCSCRRLFMLLVIAALARPMLSWLPGQLVVVVDVSASMGALDGGVTRLDRGPRGPWAGTGVPSAWLARPADGRRRLPGGSRRVRAGRRRAGARDWCAADIGWRRRSRGMVRDARIAPAARTRSSSLPRRTGQTAAAATRERDGSRSAILPRMSRLPVSTRAASLPAPDDGEVLASVSNYGADATTLEVEISQDGRAGATAGAARRARAGRPRWSPESRTSAASSRRAS